MTQAKVLRARWRGAQHLSHLSGPRSQRKSRYTMELRSNQHPDQLWACEGNQKKPPLQRLCVRIPGLGDPILLSSETWVGRQANAWSTQVSFPHTVMTDDGAHQEEGCLGVRGIMEAQDSEQHRAHSEHPPGSECLPLLYSTEVNAEK